jgi:hypothetical protein
MEKSRKLSLRRVVVAAAIGLATLGSVQATHHVLTSGRPMPWSGSAKMEATPADGRPTRERGEPSERLAFRAVDGRTSLAIDREGPQGRALEPLAKTPRSSRLFADALAEGWPRFDTASRGFASEGQTSFTAQAKDAASRLPGHGKGSMWQGASTDQEDTHTARGLAASLVADAGPGASLEAGGVFGDGRLLSGRPDVGASPLSAHGGGSLQLGASPVGRPSPAASSPAVQSPVPEPGTWAMAAIGLCIIGVATRRRRRAAASETRAS